MGATKKPVRQSITLPRQVARQVSRMARGRRVSASRMLVQLVEAGIEAGKKREEEFFQLAGRFRSADDPAEVKRLGNELGRMVFGE